VTRTELATGSAQDEQERPFGFRIVGLEGPRAGEVLARGVTEATVGSHQSNAIVLEEPTVSRFHCEVNAGPEGVRVRDVGSRNGTYLDGAHVFDALARDGSVLRLGKAALQVQLETERRALRLHPGDRFGRLVGRSPAMRAAFAQLALASKSDATVLLEGETGTGKELAAESIHAESARSKGPFVIVDCAALPPNLIESELFGHEKGAFTGATGPRAGAFEAASGGTVFLDEIGELPIDLQPRLLRVLEQRTIQRVGSTTRKPIDVRVVAATHRDLRREVNERRFRSDLYYRLAVVRVTLPALRERPDDLAALATTLLERLGASPDALARLTSAGALAHLRRGAWPGNVRELRNHLESALVLDGADDDQVVEAGEAPAVAGLPPVDLSVGFVEARRRALAAFERSYATALVAQHGGSVSKAAEAAGIDRTYLHRVMRRSVDRTDRADKG
jgi:two-component system, NtrC family, response regulator GlrR